MNKPTNFFIPFCFLTLAIISVSCDKGMKNLIDTKWTLEKITTAYGQQLIPTDYYTVLVKENQLNVKLDINACKVPFRILDKKTIAFSEPAACTEACCDTELAKSLIDKLKGEMTVIHQENKLQLIGRDTIYMRKWTSDDVKKETKEDYIKIKRTGCFGTCPIYEMTLFDDGSAAFHGKRFVRTEGNAMYQFEKDRIQELLIRAEELNFKNFEESYDDKTISDLESVYIEYNKQTVHVRDRMNVPKELLMFIHDVHRCAIDAGWIDE